MLIFFSLFYRATGNASFLPKYPYPAPLLGRLLQNVLHSLCMCGLLLGSCVPEQATKDNQEQQADVRRVDAFDKMEYDKGVLEQVNVAVWVPPLPPLTRYESKEDAPISLEQEANNGAVLMPPPPLTRYGSKEDASISLEQEANNKLEKLEHYYERVLPADLFISFKDFQFVIEKYENVTSRHATPGQQYQQLHRIRVAKHIGKKKQRNELINLALNEVNEKNSLSLRWAIQDQGEEDAHHDYIDLRLQYGPSDAPDTKNTPRFVFSPSLQQENINYAPSKIFIRREKIKKEIEKYIRCSEVLFCMDISNKTEKQAELGK